MSISRTLVGSAVVLGVCGSALAGPEVMDFQSLEVIDAASHGQGNPVIEGSYQVLSSHSVGFFSIGTQSAAAYAGSTGLYNGVSSGVTTLTKVGGGTFAITSIDLSLLTNPGGTAPVNFVGTYADTTTVTLPTISLTTFGFATYNFTSAWTGLTKVTWTQAPNHHQFDNISVTDNPVIPLPSGAAMAMVGMGVIGVRRRRPISKDN